MWAGNTYAAISQTCGRFSRQVPLFQEVGFKDVQGARTRTPNPICAQIYVTELPTNL